MKLTREANDDEEEVKKDEDWEQKDGSALIERS